MSDFAFWEKWGAGLDDTAFASAWAALGCLAGEGVAIGGERRVEVSLEAALHRASGRDGALAWKYPSPAWAAAFTLIGREPGWYAETWGRIASGPLPLRLRVQDAPPDEPIAPWLRLLAEARPAPVSVSLALPASRTSPRLGSPLRVGAVGRAVTLVGAMAGSRGATSAPALDACDLLVIPGTAKDLGTALRPARARVAVVVLRDALATPWGALRRPLDEALAATEASGFVVFSERAADADVVRVLSRMAEHLAGGAPIDVALAGGRDPGDPFDVVAGFTDALLACRPGVVKGAPPERVPRMTRGGRARIAPDAKRSAPPTAGAEPPRADATTVAPATPSRPSSTTATAAAAKDEGPDRKRAAPPAERFLQQESFVSRRGDWELAEGGFVAGADARVDVYIGPPHPTRDQLAMPFPMSEVPPNAELTVWLTEPEHLPGGVRGALKLDEDRTGGPCTLTFRLGPDRGSFAGRISVLHEGRVIQTAALQAAVRGEKDAPVAGGTPKLHTRIEVLAVKPGERRRAFDCAFVLNHDPDGTPLAVALSKDHAWISNVTDAVTVGNEINQLLSPVARSVGDYKDGLDAEPGREVLVKLARRGRKLHDLLIARQLGARGNRPDIAKAEFIQIVSTRTDAVVPFEFVYEADAPELDAKVCPRWRSAVEEAWRDDAAEARATCATGCERDTGAFVCPLAFWGMQKVIERHAYAPELAESGRDLFLQSVPERESDTLSLGGAAVVGASKNVGTAPFQLLLDTLRERTGQAPSAAGDWKAWPDLVDKVRPRLIIALPHTDRDGFEVTLELGADVKHEMDIKRRFIHPGEHDPRPLVALLGCDTACTGEDYGKLVPVVQVAGAAIVVATIATVFGDHAAVVATRLVEALLPPGAHEPVRLGEVLRAVKRRALLDKLFMPLCVVAYGDADWKLTR